MVTNNDSFEAVNEPEEPVGTNVEPTEPSGSLPMGTDSSFLFAGREEKVLEIVHAGQRWQFKYKDLSWGQKNACVDEAQRWDPEAGFQFSVSKYYAAALTRMLTDTPIHPVTETTLNQLDRAIGQKLISLVPQPVEQDLDEVKKA